MTFKEYTESHNLQATHEDIQWAVYELGCIIDFMESASGIKFQTGYFLLNCFLQDTANAITENALTYSLLEELMDDYRERLLDVVAKFYFDRFKGDKNKIINETKAMLDIMLPIKGFDKEAILNILTKPTPSKAADANNGEDASQEGNQGAGQKLLS